MKITKDMGIMEIANRYPQSVMVFQSYGMGCVGCMAARYETLEEGAQAHGIDVEELVWDLNENI